MLMRESRQRRGVGRKSGEGRDDEKGRLLKWRGETRII